MKLRTYIVIIALCVGIPLAVFLLQMRNGKPLADVSPKAADRFQIELQDCWSYNRTLYESERRKIERGNDVAGNPKSMRLTDLEQWYSYEQDACQQSYRGKLNPT